MTGKEALEEYPEVCKEILMSYDWKRCGRNSPHPYFKRIKKEEIFGPSDAELVYDALKYLSDRQVSLYYLVQNAERNRNFLPEDVLSWLIGEVEDYMNSDVRHDRGKNMRRLKRLETNEGDVE